MRSATTYKRSGETNGDTLFGLVQSYDTVAPSEKKFESHEIYADIQYLATGIEVIHYAPQSSNSPIEFIVNDPALSNLQLSATLRLDNVEGLIRFLGSGFGVRAERAGNTILFHQAATAAKIE